MTLARLLPALLVLSACSSPDWKVYRVDQRVTVQLPEQPQPVNLPGMHFASPATQEIANLPSVRAIQATTRSCFTGVIVNSQAIPAEFKQAVRDSFYTLGIRHALQRNHSKLLARTSFATPAGEGVEVKFRLAPGSSDRGDVEYMRIVLVGDASYTFQARDDQAASATDERHHFFNSITVKP